MQSYLQLLQQHNFVRHVHTSTLCIFGISAKTTCLPHPGLHKCSPALWNMLDVQLINTASIFTAKKTQSNQLSTKLKQATMWLCSEHTMCSRESREYCMYLYAVKILFFINPYNLSFGHCHQTYDTIWEQMRISNPYVYTNFMSRKRQKTTQSSQVPQPPKLTLA